MDLLKRILRVFNVVELLRFYCIGGKKYRKEIGYYATNKSIACVECGWQGTVAESLADCVSDDCCPICGNKILAYIL